MANSIVGCAPLAINGGSKSKTTPYGTGTRFGAPELTQLSEALQQNTLFYFKGNKVKEFTRKFAEMHGSKYCVATSSGTASIHVALVALGITVGDEVIVSPITDMGSVIGILYQNAIPIFADVDPLNYSMKPEAVEKAITPRTKAIIAVHLMGSPCDMDALIKISKKYNIPIIEDCAQAFGAKYRNTNLGRLGTLGCFSTNDFKHISTGDGGLIVTQDENLANRAFAAADKNYHRSGINQGQSPEFLAPNYRMTELQGAVGIAQLDRLDSICTKRHNLGSHLNLLLQDIPGILPFKVPDNGYETYFHFSGRFDLKSFNVDRKTLLDAIKAEGVPIGSYIPEPLYLYKLFKNRNIYPNNSYPLEGTGKSYSYEKGLCPIAEEVLESIFIISFNEFYTNQDIEETANAIKKVTKAYIK